MPYHRPAASTTRNLVRFNPFVSVRFQNRSILPIAMHDHIFERPARLVLDYCRIPARQQENPVGSALRRRKTATSPVVKIIGGDVM